MNTTSTAIAAVMAADHAARIRQQARRLCRYCEPVAAKAAEQSVRTALSPTESLMPPLASLLVSGCGR